LKKTSVRQARPSRTSGRSISEAESAPSSSLMFESMTASGANWPCPAKCRIATGSAGAAVSSSFSTAARVPSVRCAAKSATSFSDSVCARFSARLALAYFGAIVTRRPAGRRLRM
jgi:hypothetical protein